MFHFRLKHPSIVLGFCLTLFVGLNIVSSTAQEFNSNCALFEGDTLIEQSHCKATILKTSSGEEEGGNLTNYQWANGRVIVTQNVEEFFTINGDEGQTEFTKDGYDLCVTTLKDNKTFCTGSLQGTQTAAEPANETIQKQSSPHLSSKYADWANFAWCEVRNQDDYIACRAELSQCERDNEIATFSCPELGICSYSSKGELKSRSACLLKHNTSANGKAWIGDFKWQNGNRLELVEFEHKFLMNDESVKQKRNGNERCYFTRNKREEFCFRQNETYRFSDALAEFTKTRGVWTTPETNCADGRPFDGSITIFENSFYEKQKSLLYWSDDVDHGQAMGIESNSCHVINIIKTGKETFTGSFKCGGEAIENESETGLNRAEGTMIIKVKPNEELILMKHGEQERYVQCEGYPVRFP